MESSLLHERYRLALPADHTRFRVEHLEKVDFLWNLGTSMRLFDKSHAHQQSCNNIFRIPHKVSRQCDFIHFIGLCLENDFTRDGLLVHSMAWRYLSQPWTRLSAMWLGCGWCIQGITISWWSATYSFFANYRCGNGSGRKSQEVAWVTTCEKAPNCLQLFDYS